ncbi:BZ3500_MvSof-1268-A1-R1_Chr10-1g02651 [Microbotryum saponariae]|uniref:BZ3500_MvSof-1268-A1-R1_Chr10-1g02651 protein n=1 Tax=Microbotryum saponariae TaxID=289078 RepID=A0A2X0LLL1_9BASI|nr:BZ3500_MvSof-1268-A1-R1_Chr10-1g02651 [Microbotryum saponariae]SDA06140.1 BZ3501_MvSof-1269-A2-R1_Chr10-1g02252 [Microbotryum saponariae]
MASYYSRRASYVASWAPQRIYPLQEPSFEPPASADAPQNPAAPLSPSLSRASATRANSSQDAANADTVPTSATSLTTATTTREPTTRLQAPPMYYPGQAQLARTRAAAAAATGLDPELHASSSTNVASSITATIPWQSHPTATHVRPIKRFLRVPLWWSGLTKESEVLWQEWPREFGGTKMLPSSSTDDEEQSVQGRFSTSVTRSLSRRSGASAADSGIALTPRPTFSSSSEMPFHHPLEPLFKSRIEELNELIPQRLGPSRVWLAALEIINWLWIVALIVALAQGKGKQTEFLEGVELTLIVIIVLNGIGVNAVRMRRWALARALRLRSRDWSPLPTTTSTNAQLLNNAQLQGLGEEREDVQMTTERTRGKDQPTLRWKMRETEVSNQCGSIWCACVLIPFVSEFEQGSWWLSYRPIIKCELVMPSVTHARHHVAPLHPLSIDLPAHDTAEASRPPPPLSSTPPPLPSPVLPTHAIAEEDHSHQGDAPAYSES